MEEEKKEINEISVDNPVGKSVENPVETPEEGGHIKQTKTQLLMEILRFLVVGGTATIADYFVFWLLDGLLLPLIPLEAGWWTTTALVIATAFGFVTGMLVNWALSVSFVFKAVRNKEEATSKKSFMIYIVICLIGLGLTQLGVLLLSKIIPEFSLFGFTGILGTSWAKWVAKVITTCVVLVWNYLGRKIFIFKS